MKPLLIGMLALAGLAACDDDPAPVGPQPPPLTLPDEPDAPQGAGNFTVEQRGITLDADDFAVLVETTNNGITLDRIRNEFGRLVVNRPYVDWRASICVDSDDASRYQPRATLEELVDDLSTQRSLSFEKIAVNVDLLSPAGQDLIFVCYGADDPRFDVLPHREAVVAAFIELAQVPNVDYITVGLEMNRYYHLRVGDDRVIDDYTNFITLYREVYDAVKAENPAIKVGPGLSWATFQRRTVPDIADELGLEDDGMEAFVRAWERTVQPLLGSTNARTADFVGLSMIPFVQESPFNGVPAPDDVAAITEYHRRIPVLADGLPVTFSQIDWPGAVRGPKGDYLTTLKAATAHVDLAWAAWRRTSDVPDTVGASPCAKYTQAREATLAYPQDFCTAGLVSDNNSGKPVLEVFVAE
ncbi:MAG: hypothetical protein ACI9U2_002244 [Bradymonadia bacterium]|jgi:hypothetical protein